MAPLRTRKLDAGTPQWVVTERREANDLVMDEAEEFGYSVRNELEWLNEHMREIFTSQNLNVADTFKTPGKLRGKTPRTARKRAAGVERAPLADIFAPNPQSASTSPTKNAFYKQVAQFQVASDAALPPSSPPAPTIAPVGVGKENTDSGYHGMTDDEFETDENHIAGLITEKLTQRIPSPVYEPSSEEVAEPAEERRVTEETFVSAKEDLESRKLSAPDVEAEPADDDTVPDEELMEVETEPQLPNQVDTQATESTQPVPSFVYVQQAKEAIEADPVDGEVEADLNDQLTEDVRSPSEGSSPAKPLLRKSSLTFASLPAREPLAGKKSFGARTSRTSHIDQFKGALGRFTGGKSLGGAQVTASLVSQDGETQHATESFVYAEDSSKPMLQREPSERTKVHNQTTTQRLTDRINLLGQSRDLRTSKSITHNAFPQQVYPHLPTATETAERVAPEVVEKSANLTLAQNSHAVDDEAAPVQPKTSHEQPATNAFTGNTVRQVQADTPERRLDTVRTQQSPGKPISPFRTGFPFSHKKAVSTTALVSPTRAAMATSHKKTISVSNPSVAESMTPAGSPKRHNDGPLSASKAKLYSVLRSAKGIFASSAGISAQAKVEALSTAPRPRPATIDEVFNPGKEAQAQSIYPNFPGGFSQTSLQSTATSGPSEGRRTRSSTDREQKQREEEKRITRMQEELDKVREKERQKASAAAQKVSRVPSPSKESLAPQSHRSEAPSRADYDRMDVDMESADEMPPPPPPKSGLPTASAQRLRQPRRLPKPTKEPPKTQSVPVTVRMPSQRIGHVQPTNSMLAQSLHESLPPAPPPKGPPSLHHSSSSSSLKSGNSSQAAKKALDAAAKKKEQEMKLAQRKADQKREIEQKRAQKIEEDRRRQEEERRKADEDRRRQEDERRRQDEQRRLEQQRKIAEQEAKRLAQKQAADAKRLEQQRREQQRKEAQRQNEMAAALQQEKAAASGLPRADLGGARPMSRLGGLVQDPSRPLVQMNPAKPPKRIMQFDDDDEPQRPTAQRNPPSYQQLDSKRRKTNEMEEEVADQRRSVMAPPIRQSNIRKDNPKLAPPSWTSSQSQTSAHAQHTASMFVKTVTAQHNMQHNMGQPDMAKYANAKIPFADAPNPGPSQGQFKTPGRPLPKPGAQKSAVKSSPHYPQGDNIELPNIATDSEDEDSDNEFQAAEWTATPVLSQMLSQQELVDPADIFGPIAPLRMEEVFSKSKDRFKKFRERTSSANWSGSDRLTQEERLRDMEARQKLVRDGMWTYQPER
ncbi:hypothetical protein EJ06DRAFT_293656 [Trichodelitschia bisporula]|uniref:Inner centromere protein ARK-binding domain-containing protein n=1 Tax=Trichodelitschia bisporula TaxID=703511 RepID=A0A6G1I6W3_9PEZI|nr:hypothetical protein EJ06DRAFT_293656 [Trichodelitschia bisporula]